MLHVGDAGGSDIRYRDQMRRLFFSQTPDPLPVVVSQT